MIIIAKSHNSKIGKELDENLMSVNKNTIEDEDSILDGKNSEIGESAKKAKKKKKKSKSKAGKESDSMPNITVNSERTEQDETLILNANQTTLIDNTANANNSYFTNQFVNDTMLMPTPQNFIQQNNFNNKNNNNTYFDESMLNNTNNNNTNLNLNHSGIPMFPPNMMHSMQAGIFLNPNAPKVINPQIDPAKNLNFFIPNTNLFHPNIILEPVEIENIFKLNKKFNIAYEHSLWYIFNPLNASMSLPLSSRQICDMYNMNLINGEVDIRPIDVFKFKSKNLLAFVKLKMLNDPDWAEDLVDSRHFNDAEVENNNNNNLKNNKQQNKENFVEETNNFVNYKNGNNVYNTNTNRNNYNMNNDNKEEKVGFNNDDNFEVVGAKKGKIVFGGNQNSNNLNANKSKKLHVASQAVGIGIKNNFVPASIPANTINKNDFNSLSNKKNTPAKPVAQINANNFLIKVKYFSYF